MGFFSAIGAAIGAIASAAGKIVSGIAKMGVEVLKVVADGFTAIAKSLGIIKPEREVEEVGNRAMQAEEMGMTPEKYGSYEAWVKAIDEDDWGYDPEKNANLDPEEKLRKGAEVSAAVTMEHFPDLPIQDFFSLANNNPSFFAAARMSEFGKLAAGDTDTFGDVVEFVSGKSNDYAVIDSATEALIKIEKSLDSSLDDNMAYDKILNFTNNNQNS